MGSTTHTTAGRLALAAASRPGAAPAPASAVSYAAPAAPAAHVLGMGGHGIHQDATWTTGAIAETTTSVVFDRKNRPPRPLSERSP